jgi:uncharacterized protein YodC (DUF2158 family)
MAFKIGDQVQLKSGSPIMTVTSLGKDGQGNPLVICTWFDDRKQNSGGYLAEALKAYSSEKGSTEGSDDDGDFMTR